MTRIIDIRNDKWHLVIEHDEKADKYYVWEFYDEEHNPYPVHRTVDKTLEEAKNSACSAFWDILNVHQ